MRNLVIDGRLGRDAELKTTSGGTQCVQFSLANTVYDGKNGEVTDWFDITSYDPFVVNTLFKSLKKGSYVFVTSNNFKTNVNIKNGTVYVNHYVTANGISFGSNGSKKEPSDNEETISVYSPKAEAATVISEPVKTTELFVASDIGDDDLPF